MTVAGYLKARYKSDALVVITSLGLIVMCIGTFLFLFFVLRAGGGLLSYWILVGFGTLGLP